VQNKISLTVVVEFVVIFAGHFKDCSWMKGLAGLHSLAGLILRCLLRSPGPASSQECKLGLLPYYVLV